MINVDQLRHKIVRPALKILEPVIPWTMVSENLIIGTGMVESQFQYVVQFDDGPARGFFQMEPATHNDIYWNYLQYRDDLADLIPDGPRDWERLVYDIQYAAIMCRIHYWRVREALPRDPWDAFALGGYWKAHYNTIQGAGSVGKFQTWFSYVT